MRTSAILGVTELRPAEQADRHLHTVSAVERQRLSPWKGNTSVGGGLQLGSHGPMSQWAPLALAALPPPRGSRAWRPGLAGRCYAYFTIKIKTKQNHHHNSGLQGRWGVRILLKRCGGVKAELKVSGPRAPPLPRPTRNNKAPTGNSPPVHQQGNRCEPRGTDPAEHQGTVNKPQVRNGADASRERR